MRFQNRLSSISGPKAAPKPAHANDVMPKMVELEFQAIAMATMVMSTSVMREHHMTCFFGGVLLEYAAVEVLADGAGRDQQIGIRGRDGRGQDTRAGKAREDGRQIGRRGVDEDIFRVVVGEVIKPRDAAADDADEHGGGHRDHDPDDRHAAGERPSSCSERMPMNRSRTCGMPK